MSANVSGAVRFEKVTRTFKEVRAADDLDFEVSDGEFFSMLGPSGSGKTTCLRLIAGFEIPDSGKIYIHNQEMSHIPPYERDVNTVFQDYALFPHMNVIENVTYSLMLKKVSKAERFKQAEEMLELVQLPGFATRKPSELSGGQRQRVALARSLINHPSVLLLDEPLGALDLKLREQMQMELKALQKKVGITFIYVTHDQQEALNMSDRIAVFNQGKIEQIGTTKEIYENPQTLFVAGFVGSSNVIPAALAEKLWHQSGVFSIRPERIQFAKAHEALPADQYICMTGEVMDIQYQGASFKYTIRIPESHEIFIQQPNLQFTKEHLYKPRIGEKVRVYWNRLDLHELQR